MNKYDEKSNRMRQHLISHPTDYQTVVSLFVAESNSIAYEKEKQQFEKQKEIAKHSKGRVNFGRKRA